MARKPKSYMACFNRDKRGQVRAGRQFLKKEGKYKSQTHRLIGAMYRLAKKHTGMNGPQIAYYLRMGKTDNTIMKRVPQLLGEGDTTRIRYDRYLALADMAKIPRAIAIVLYCQSFIPKEFEHHKKYVGLAARRWPRTAQFGQDTYEENKEVSDALHEEVQHNAKVVPELKKIRSGIILESPKELF